jgi:hypothetical protein
MRARPQRRDATRSASSSQSLLCGWVLVSRGGFLTWLGAWCGRPARAPLRGRRFARRLLRMMRRRRFAAQDNSNHCLGLRQQQLALLLAVLIAPFEAGLIGLARPSKRALKPTRPHCDAVRSETTVSSAMSSMVASWFSQTKQTYRDACRSRYEPAFKLACGRLPETDRDLCSQPTRSRLENTPCLREASRLRQVGHAFHSLCEALHIRRKLLHDSLASIGAGRPVEIRNDWPT